MLDSCDTVCSLSDWICDLRYVSVNANQPLLVLTNLGEKMSDDEVDELLKAVDTSSGEINYTDLVRTILAN